MKRIPPIAYLVVLLGCLVAAYFTWTKGPEKTGGEVAVLECGKGELQKVTLREKDRQVVFSRRGGAGSAGTAWWVDASGFPPPKPKETIKPPDEVMPNTSKDLDADAASMGPSEDTPEAAKTPEPGQSVAVAPVEEGVLSESFKGNEQLGEALGDLCPWRALRSLGKPDDRKRGEFGLLDTKDCLVLEVRGKPRKYLLGTATLGPGDRYIENEATGEVFLVAGQGVKNLLYPKSRFMERSLHAFKEDEVARLLVRAGDRENELVHRVSKTGVDEGWSQTGDSSEAKAIFGNWVQKVFSLRPVDYVIPEGSPTEAGSAECADPPGTETSARMTFFDKKQEIGFLTIYRTEGDQEKAEYSACTENTGAVVKLPKTQVEGVLEDMEDLLPEPSPDSLSSKGA